ncbi:MULTISPECIES: nucleoside deaminase [Methanobacterium]|jgi:tRNA(Arg) A34 adenosine deaminase TadA|uniref:Nucleoside deaminase n=1 Tax=Methanobacterium veterum TaxID=408577 RepID=A0A9E5A4S8_9EURY|nr:MULTISPECIES: nucleoside deaminase [Methanobacterium]MCZ3367362.1 nucleoside deaminase [Methanobacterium veterum]MCZ3373490.1 nucleoside deaminase [Methanobacterium veterum]
MEKDHKFMNEAIIEAKKSLKEDGIPIGAVLVKNGEIISRGHNRLLQKDSSILHGEMDCIENAGKLKGEDYKSCILYTTLSPCEMCSGTILLYKIPKVVMGENKTLKGPEDYLKENGVELINLDLKECKDIMKEFIKRNPEIWDAEIDRVI